MDGPHDERMKPLLVTVSLFALLLPATARAAPETHVLVETDPATFGFRGFAGHLRVQPASTPHWTFGAGLYAMNLPGLLVDTNPDNRDEGWDVRLRLGAGLFADYAWSADGDGPVVGLQTAIHAWRATAAGAVTDERFTSALLMARLGYLWRPRDGGFFVMPWIGLGLTRRIAGDDEREGGYATAPVMPMAALHVGWRF